MPGKFVTQLLHYGTGLQLPKKPRPLYSHWQVQKGVWFIPDFAARDDVTFELTVFQQQTGEALVAADNDTLGHSLRVEVATVVTTYFLTYNKS